MVRVPVDFSDVQEFEPLEKGEYPAIVTEVEYRDSETHGKEYDSLEWRIEYTEGEAKGRKGWFYTSFSPKAMWRMKQVFENLGLPADKLDLEVDEDTNLVTSPELAGMPVIAVVTVSTYEGRITNNIDTLLPAEGTSKPKKAGGKGGAKTPAKAGGKKFK